MVTLRKKIYGEKPRSFVSRGEGESLVVLYVDFVGHYMVGSNLLEHDLEVQHSNSRFWHES